MGQNNGGSGSSGDGNGQTARPPPSRSGDKDSRHWVQPQSTTTAHVWEEANHRADLFKSTVLRCPSGLPGAPARPSPSIFTFPGLRAHPIWAEDDLSPSLAVFSARLRKHAPAITSEYLNLVRRHQSSDYIRGEHEKALHKGQWDWFSFVKQGELGSPSVWQLCPTTFTVLTGSVSAEEEAEEGTVKTKGKEKEEQGEEGRKKEEGHNVPFYAPSSNPRDCLQRNIPFAYTFFSRMVVSAGTKAEDVQIAPHTSPSNLRLRCHLPLILPDPSQADCALRVGHEIVRYQLGEPVWFDDSFEHEAWLVRRRGQKEVEEQHDVTTEKRKKEQRKEDKRPSGLLERVVLLIDVWHPDLSHSEIKSIQSMFQFAQEKGWYGGAGGSKKSDS